VLDGDRQDALDVLGDCVLWHLPARRWDEIEQVVREVERALARGDAAAFRRASADLGLLGPVRGASAEGPPPEPAPERLRERVDQLITSLLGPRPGRPPHDDRG
jgi:hypothetical protein